MANPSIDFEHIWSIVHFLLASPNIRVDSVTLLRYCSAIARQLCAAPLRETRWQRVSGPAPLPPLDPPPMPRPPLTPEQWAQARRLRDGGATFAAIAREIGAHESTIAGRARLEGWPRPAGSLPAAARGTGAFHRAESIADIRIGPLLAFEALRAPVWAPRDYATFAREGFAANAIVYRCVRMVSEAAASVPLLLYEGPHEDPAAPPPRSDRPPQPRLQRSRPAGIRQRLPARLRQRLPRGRRPRRQPARAARAASRPHEGEPQSLIDPDSIEGRITHQEATAEAAEARLAEILRNAIPNTKSPWGVNRLTKELHERGFVLERPTDLPGLLFTNSDTGEEVRIMERPPRQRRSDPQEKHTFEHYYRYRSGPGKREGAHVPIPDKD